MLGEAAFTDHDAERYFESYLEAVRTLGERKDEWDELPRPTISIKLSALHPRYEEAHQHDVMTELADRVSQLVKEARALGVGITIDAEEMDRLELSLRLFKQVFNSEDARGWGHFGLVIQAYSKRALAVLGYLTKLAQQQGDIIPIRLVKGAYWDTEVKHAQQLGLADYPVYTRKDRAIRYFVTRKFLARVTCLAKADAILKAITWPWRSSVNPYWKTLLVSIKSNGT